MAVEHDNDAERNERIDKILQQIRETQTRVEREAAEGRARASELARKRRLRTQLPTSTDPE